MTWNNPLKKKNWITKGQYLAIFGVDFIMQQGAYGGPRAILGQMVLQLTHTLANLLEDFYLCSLQSVSELYKLGSLW